MSTGEDQSEEKNELRLRKSPAFKHQVEEEEEEPSDKIIEEKGCMWRMKSGTLAWMTGLLLLELLGHV